MVDYEPFTSRTLAETIRQELDNDDEMFALRMLIQGVVEFRATLAGGDVEAINRFLEMAPATTGSVRWDTLLSASVGRECRLAKFAGPAWVHPEPLENFWFVDPLPSLAARSIQHTSADLAAVGIWLDQKAFATA